VAFRFSGIITRATAVDLRHNALKTGHKVRPLEAPKTGSAIVLPDWEPGPDALRPYLEALGIGGFDWVYLMYQTWAGPITEVRWYGQSGKTQSPDRLVEGAGAPAHYLAMMQFAGLEEQAQDFAPLRRGFFD